MLDDQREGYAGSGTRSCLILPRLPKLAVFKAIEVKQAESSGRLYVPSDEHLAARSRNRSNNASVGMCGERAEVRPERGSASSVLTTGEVKLEAQRDPPRPDIAPTTRNAGKDLEASHACRRQNDGEDHVCGTSK